MTQQQVTRPTFCWRHSLQARLTPGRRRFLASGEASALSSRSSSKSWSWSWSRRLAGLLSNVLRLRFAGPVPFRPWLRMPAANSGLSMAGAAPPEGGERKATVWSRASGFPDSRGGTGRGQIGCWPRQFARWEVRSRGCDGRELKCEKADLRKAGVSCTPVLSGPSWSGAGPPERGKALHFAHRILTGGARACALIGLRCCGLGPPKVGQDDSTCGRLHLPVPGLALSLPRACLSPNPQFFGLIRICFVLDLGPSLGFVRTHDHVRFLHRPRPSTGRNGSARIRPMVLHAQQPGNLTDHTHACYGMNGYRSFSSLGRAPWTHHKGSNMAFKGDAFRHGNLFTVSPFFMPAISPNPTDAILPTSRLSAVSHLLLSRHLGRPFLAVYPFPECPLLRLLFFTPSRKCGEHGGESLVWPLP